MSSVHFDPQHRRREPWGWLCSICSGVAARATRVTYEIGLSSVRPHLRCDPCLEDLRALEVLSARGQVLSTSEYVWAIQVLEVIEAPARREPHPDTGSPATLRAERGTRAIAVGGIEL